MEWNADLQIPKKLKRVSLWLHPEGRVVGSLFLNLRSKSYVGEEDPQEVLNQDASFIVLQCDQPDELRFYNVAAITRVEYRDDSLPQDEGIEPLACRFQMMDGAIIEGDVRKALPPHSSRLYDYLNADDEQFIKVHGDNGGVCLIKKSYIACVTSRHARSGADTEWPQEALETTNNIF